MQQEEPPRLTIATCNILADSYIKPGRHTNSPPADLLAENRHPRLIERVAGFGAGVICLQEIEYRMFTMIDARLRGLGYRGRWAHKARGKPDGCATFLRDDLHCLDSRIVVFDDGHLPAGPSGHVALETLVQSGQMAVTIVNTHLRWDQPGTPKEERYGLTQARIILQRACGSFFPTIVCGDLNAEPDDEMLAAFEADGFRDAHPKSAMTANSNGRAKKIDYLLGSPDLSARPWPVERIADDTPLPSETEPSDHLPLTATFTPI